jgi:GDP-L-fucose synthase
MADACVYLMQLSEERYTALLGSDESVSGRFEPPLVNIGVGEDVTIAELAALVAKVVGYQGGIVYDTSKPDGTPRKLMDVGLMKTAGWQARTQLEDGLRVAYAEFAAQQAAG